jgi:hypothetical protein
MINKEEMRKAIKDTIKLHQKCLEENRIYEGSVLTCPLCWYDNLHFKEDVCLACPWVIFEGRTCSFDKVANSKKSIERLNRWLGQLEEYSED